MVSLCGKRVLFVALLDKAILGGDSSVGCAVKSVLKRIISAQVFEFVLWITEKPVRLNGRNFCPNMGQQIFQFTE